VKSRLEGANIGRDCVDISRRTAITATAGLAAMTSASGIWAATTSQQTPPVETAAGKVRGLRSGTISRFLGIPYGADTGPRRFQTAGAPTPWAGVRDCFAFGAQAPQGQLGIAGLNMTGAAPSPVAREVMAIFANSSDRVPESEECLFLNVYTPALSRGGKRPVFVWLHGGGFALGSGGTAAYDGSNLARRGDAVVVTINHRLNAMGYLYLGAFHEDFADSGNVGQLDIVLALQWVRDNIAAFGGDPGNVTIFGESGGGAKVGTLMGMVPAKGLFHKAVQQSGAAVTMAEKAEAIQVAERTLAALGIAPGDVHKLQNLPAKQIIAAASAVRLPTGARSLVPVVDGRSLPAHPFSPQASELSRDVPLIIGTTKDEWTMFMATDPAFGTMTQEQARQRFKMMAGPRADAAFEFYRKARPSDPPTYWVTALMTDQAMRTNSILEADRKAAQGGAPIYMYRLDWEAPILNKALRSPHGLDVPLVFDNVTGGGIIGDGVEAKQLANVVSQAWVNFARTGNPSTRTLRWPRYTVPKRETMIFDLPSRVVSDPDRASREFWSA
jgi:para-nitrobenzyl esterase